MKYRNASEFLPKELLSALQAHAEGELIYVPNRPRSKAGWGTLNGAREKYAARNMQMVGRWLRGASMEEISRQFYLSKDSIKKIIRAYSAQTERN